MDRGSSRDLLIAAVIALTVFAVCLIVDFAGWWDELHREHTAWDLHTLEGAILGLLVGSLWLAARRIRAGKAEIEKRKLSEQALELEKQNAERANAGKSRFLAAASHDLRQPLQALSLFAGALQEAKMAGDQRKIVEAMGDTINNMGSMLGALRDISRLDTGEVAAEVSDFEIAPLLKRLHDELAFKANANAVDLRFVACSATLRSDPQLLESIVTNMISNAISFAPSGRVLIGCRRAGEAIRIEVWDNGIGIDEQDLSSIFDDYYQVENDARERERGLGLGLALVDRLAKLLGHKIVVRSQKDRGSMFGIEVPLGEPRTVPEPEESLPETAATADGTILLIDDDAEVAKASALLIESWGYRVVLAGDSESALQAVEQEDCRPDIVLADYRLPGGTNGVQTITKIRERLGSPLSAIVISGDQASEIQQSAAAENCDLLLKPVKAKKLRSLLRYYMKTNVVPPAEAQLS